VGEREAQSNMPDVDAAMGDFSERQKMGRQKAVERDGGERS
jgi:hypothetical protein